MRAVFVGHASFEIRLEMTMLVTSAGSMYRSDKWRVEFVMYAKAKDGSGRRSRF